MFLLGKGLEGRAPGLGTNGSQMLVWGFFWYEFDITWWGLWVMEKLGLIWDVRPIPDHARSE